MYSNYLRIFIFFRISPWPWLFLTNQLLWDGPKQKIFKVLMKSCVQITWVIRFFIGLTLNVPLLFVGPISQLFRAFYIGHFKNQTLMSICCTRTCPNRIFLTRYLRKYYSIDTKIELGCPGIRNQTRTSSRWEILIVIAELRLVSDIFLDWSDLNENRNVRITDRVSYLVWIGLASLIIVKFCFMNLGLN